MPSDDGDSICSACINSASFASWINENGEDGTCSFDQRHGGPRKVVSVEEFAAEVDRWFRSRYGHGDTETHFDEDDRTSHVQRGEPYQDIIGEEIGCKPQLLRRIVDALPDTHWHEISQGGEKFYDDSANYESFAEVEARERADAEEYYLENKVTFAWEEFCEAVQYQGRFFLAKERLDELFGDAEEYRTGKPAPLRTLPIGETIYRARLLNDELTEERVRQEREQCLSSPPRDRATAGRMNVDYIPAFYAAFSSEAALAELRPSIGDRIAIGRFKLRRNVFIFDFTAFSYFEDGDHPRPHGHSRYSFLTQMEEAISRPVLPYERQRRYIPTQIVAEYLRDMFKCEGLIYRSSMHKARLSSFRNIVLFESSGVGFVGTESQPLTFVDYEIREVSDVKIESFTDPF